MGAKVSASDKIEPTQLDNIEQSRSRPNSETSEKFNVKRTTTDVFFLLLMALFFVVFLGVYCYCIFYGDIFRILNGYDNCGNVCGKKNDFHITATDGSNCTALDQTHNKYHIVIRNNTDSRVKIRECVPDCDVIDGYRPFFNRCVPKRDEKVVDKFFSKTGLRNFFEEVSEDFNMCWREIIYLCLISLGLSVFILILFRYLVGFVVWIVLLGVAIACCAGTIFLWILWKAAKDGTDLLPSINISEIDSRKTGTYLTFAIIATVVTVLVILVIFVMRKRIKLVVQLFKESGKAVACMPVLLIEPVLTFICLGVVIFLWFYFCLWIESSGILTPQNLSVYHYQKDVTMKVTRWYNILAMFWMTQFIIGCQHMVIAGAVSTWYFTRDKRRLQSPVIVSAYNLSRYHLGSVAFGSLIIAIVQLARLILKTVEKYLKGKEGKCIECTLKCCQCCLHCFEKFLKYLTRNAYIEIAMYGHSFCTASKQAFKLLSSNVLRVAAINSVGDFVLFLGKVLVVMATVLIGIAMLQNKEGLQHMWVPITLAGLFAYFVSHCFITVYEMAIDTIFLCFCEDCEQNDGVNKPYYMSKGLMEFVENSKKALHIQDNQPTNATQAW